MTWCLEVAARPSGKPAVTHLSYGTPSGSISPGIVRETTRNKTEPGPPRLDASAVSWPCPEPTQIQRWKKRIMWITLTVIWNPEKANSTAALRTSAHSMGLSTELRSSTFLQEDIESHKTDIATFSINNLCILFFCCNYLLEKCSEITWSPVDLKQQLVGRTDKNISSPNVKMQVVKPSPFVIQFRNLLLCTIYSDQIRTTLNFTELT
jgi:hypothetical protein